MAHYESKFGENGEIVVPPPVASALKLKPGDRIDFYLDDTGQVRMIARNKNLADLKGLIKTTDGPVDVDEAIGAYLSEKYSRVNEEWNEHREFEEWRKAKKAHAAE